ncbi:hypothetical protein [Streptomyces xiamenensis]|uniref:hypothetical protein n=1 Tax=Streptomyces xiamenensis TaxID=408015 RepID=UPI0035E0A163
MSTPTVRSLTRGQILILAAAAVPMVAVGVAGAVGTYANIKTQFPSSASALGVVAAGEGATLILALVYVGLTMLGQTAPAPVRVGLWVLPAVAAGVGAVIATGTRETVVFAITPMAMCVAAEGLGLLARRIVVHSTGTDLEAQRRNAVRLQRLSFQRAKAAHHPDPEVRKKAALKSWKLAAKVGVGDADLGANLVEVQRERLSQGADAALADMFAPAVTPAATAALPAGDGAAHDSGTEHAALVAGSRPGAGAITQVSTQAPALASRPGAHAVTAAPVTNSGATVFETVTAEDAPATDGRAVTVEEVAAVAGVPVPVPGERLTDGQVGVVLRHLRYRQDPPASYRQAVQAFRDGGYVGGEQRVRRAWGELMSQEEADTQAEADGDGRRVPDEDEDEERARA